MELLKTPIVISFFRDATPALIYLNYDFAKDTLDMRFLNRSRCSVELEEDYLLNGVVGPLHQNSLCFEPSEMPIVLSVPGSGEIESTIIIVDVEESNLLLRFPNSQHSSWEMKQIPFRGGTNIFPQLTEWLMDFENISEHTRDVLQKKIFELVKNAPFTSVKFQYPTPKEQYFLGMAAK